MLCSRISQSKNVVLLYHIFGTIGPDVFFLTFKRYYFIYIQKTESRLLQQVIMIMTISLKSHLQLINIKIKL